jgi:hypothetical protein
MEVLGIITVIVITIIMDLMQEEIMAEEEEIIEIWETEKIGMELIFISITKVLEIDEVEILEVGATVDARKIDPKTTQHKTGLVLFAEHLIISRLIVHRGTKM